MRLPVRAGRHAVVGCRAEGHRPGGVVLGHGSVKGRSPPWLCNFTLLCYVPQRGGGDRNALHVPSGIPQLPGDSPASPRSALSFRPAPRPPSSSSTEELPHAPPPSRPRTVRVPECLPGPGPAGRLYRAGERRPPHAGRRAARRHRPSPFSAAPSSPASPPSGCCFPPRAPRRRRSAAPSGRLWTSWAPPDAGPPVTSPRPAEGPPFRRHPAVTPGGPLPDGAAHPGCPRFPGGREHPGRRIDRPDSQGSCNELAPTPSV